MVDVSWIKWLTVKGYDTRMLPQAEHLTGSSGGGGGQVEEQVLIVRNFHEWEMWKMFVM